MTDRRVRTIRFWLLAMGLAALGFWEPSLWLGVPLFFNACGPCNCAPRLCLSCSPTSSTPLQIAVVISGMTNDTCSDCGFYNDTFIASQLAAPGNPCFWEYLPDPNFCGTDPLTVNVVAGLSGFIRVAFTTLAGSPVVYFIDFHGGAPVNCAFSSRSVPVSMIVGSAPCNNVSATCLLTAL